ncbi:MAG: YcxB family protein, partial [Prosthecobacter sp.]|nr:YcxB family protein [Prosthecobacter sp.]
VMCAVIALAYFAYIANDLGMPVDQRAWQIYILGSVIFAIAFFGLFLIINVLNAVTMVRHSSGVIGPHEMRLSPEGLRDTTPLTDSLTRWPGVFRITRRGDYLTIWTSPFMAHIVPKRAFADQDAFEAFERQARAFWAGEQAPAVVVEQIERVRPVMVASDPALWKRPA